MNRISRGDFLEVLRYGSRGISVELLQSTLKKLGFYNGRVDGILGSNTQNAVYRFQREFGISVDGIVGRKTWNKLMPYINGVVGRIVPTDMSYPYWVMMMNIDALKEKYPFIKVGSVGNSVLGKNIPYIALGNGDNEVFYSASIHANEWINSVVMMKFIEDYSEKYKNDGEINGYKVKEIFEKTTIYIVPMINPDGVDLVLGVLPTNSTAYKNARTIASNYPNIPFPNGWKANILGFDFEKYHPLKCSNLLRLRAFLEIEMLLFFRFLISVTTILIFNIKIVKNIQNKCD